jgi:hypothetical protein
MKNAYLTTHTNQEQHCSFSEATVGTNLAQILIGPKIFWNFSNLKKKLAISTI